MDTDTTDNTLISLGEYLGKASEARPFRIPPYQRGYVWGKKRPNGETDSVTYILEKTLIPGFAHHQDADVFLQGITVSESTHAITIIDGQQRTTFFFLLLKYLNGEGFSLEYAIRQDSQNFLQGDFRDAEEKANEPYQDIYFFKKTLRTIKEQLKNAQLENIEDKAAFGTYLLEHVKFLYITIAQDQELSVFRMMNGNRAIMRQEELIKAEILRLVSLPANGEATTPAHEWELIQLRSRYARAWDSWLQWWNHDDVKTFFRCDRPMGYLLEAHYYNHCPEASKSKQDFGFVSFCSLFLKDKTATQATALFYGLRQTQKHFEDIFGDPVTYNDVGATLCFLSGDRSRIQFLTWLTASRPSEEDLRRTMLLAAANVTHNEITVDTNDNKEAISRKISDLRQQLADPLLYKDKTGSEAAFRFLLILNILLDNGLKRKFDFSIWSPGERSLEHIYPKSKVFHRGDDGRTRLDGNDNEIPERTDVYLDRKACGDTTEHGLGNLVLLYKNENSKFSDAPFDAKRSLYFSGENFNFRSRNLLHSMLVFAAPTWDGDAIQNNLKKTLDRFNDLYNLNSEDEP